MAALPIFLTEAGLAMIADAEGGGFDAIVIAEVGLTATPFEAAADVVAIPDEIKRIDAVSGLAPDPYTVHLTVRDDSDDAYDFTGFGIYEEGGALIGVYSQDEAILEKSELSYLFLAVDIRLSAPLAELFQFGDANFANPQATEDTLGVVRRASTEEAEAGEDEEKYVTPALMKAIYVALENLGVANGVATLGPDGKLTLGQRPPVDPVDFFFVGSEAAMLALAAGVGDWAIRSDTDPTEIYILQDDPATDLGNWLQLNIPAPVTSVNGAVGAVVLDAAAVGAVPTARTIATTAPLAGGGDLSANRVLSLVIASAAETLAGVINNKALVPASLADLITALNAKAASARTVTGAGLATGGGNLTADRVITVAIATAAEALAGVLNTKALTPASLVDLIALVGSKASAAINLTGGGLVTGGGTLAADRVFTVAKATAAEAYAAAIDTKAVTPAALSTIMGQLLTRAGSATNLNVGGLVQGGGNLSADRTFTVQIATPAETLAGVLNTKALTPASLAGVFEAIGAGVPASRNLVAAGLVQGGGSLAADRTFTVLKASLAEANAGVLDDRAVTPAGLSGILGAIGGKVGVARQVLGAGLVTGGGNLGGDVTLVVEKASAAEADAGAIDTKALTPASLVNILAAIAAKAAAAITVTGTGLATGGGDLTANRAINVPKASGAEVAALADDTKAVTPLALASLLTVSATATTMVIALAGVPIVQVTRTTVSANNSATVSLPTTFPTRCVAAFADGGSSAQDEDNTPFVQGFTAGSVTLYNAQNSTVTGYVLALGN